MKRFFLRLSFNLFFGAILFLGVQKTFAQFPGWDWARQATGSGGETIGGLCKDTDGNVFATGSFISPTINFGNIVLTNSGNNDIYIVKYDPQGNVIWAKNFGSSGAEVSFDIAADQNGNISIAGWFSSPSFSFDNITLNSSAGTCTGGWGFPVACSDIFVAKLDNNGNTLWARSFGIPGRSENATSIATDPNGNIIVAGEFTGTISFDNSSLFLNDGLRGIFLTKFDANGNAIWAKGFPGGNNYCRDICADPNGNVLLTGTYNFSITFDNTILTDAIGHIFVAGYSPAGNLLWAKGEGGRSNYGSATSIAANRNGVFITGNFTTGSIKFGKINLKNCKSCTNMFLVKYDPSGNVQWAKATSNTSQVSGNAVDADENGNVVVAGTFNNSSVTFGNYLLNNNGASDIFLVKYNASGLPVWATGIGAISSEGTNNVLADGTGNIYISGSFYSPSLPIGNDQLANTGQSDVFIAKANDNQTVSGRSKGHVTQEIIANAIYKIYPNPATGSISFQLPVNSDLRDLQFTIYNINGVRLREITLKSMITPITLEGFKPGTYFYTVNRKGQMLCSGKFIVL